MTTPSRSASGASRERGAATVILALFLLVMVAFALLVALNMGASDITDSAAHDDAVEALFLAESGIERAAKRFASGTPCADLAEAAMPFGRGTFTVQAATSTANVCRITVLGAVRAAHRMIRGDATTPVFEPFPDAAALAAWPEVVIRPNGNSSFDAASATADNTGSLIMQTRRGRNNRFEAYRTRTLQNNITGAQTVALNIAYKKNYTGPAPRNQELALQLLDTAGTVHLIAAFNDLSNANVWINSPTFSFNVPAGVVINRIRLHYNLRNANHPASQVFIWADNVRLTTSAAAFPLKTWTEIIQ